MGRTSKFPTASSKLTSELGSCEKFEVVSHGLPVPNSLYGFCGRRSDISRERVLRARELCVKVEVVDMGSPSLIALVVSVDVKATFEEEERTFSELRSCA